MGKYKHVFVISDIVIDEISRQAVIAMDIKLGDTSLPDLNFAKDTHVEISRSTKTATTLITCMKQQPAWVFRSTKTKPSVEQCSIPKT